MRLIPVLFVAAAFSFNGCESDQTTSDGDYAHTSSSDQRVIGRDEYEHGVPDRITDHNAEQGGISQPDTRDQSRSDVSTIDRTFVNEAAMGELFEVRSAQLALDQTDDPRIKQIASMILQDHQKANRELEMIAQRKGFQTPQQLSERYQDMMDQLQASQGDAFARQFRDVQDQAHREAIQLFERQAREGQDPDLKSFAERTLPVLRKHLDHVQRTDSPSASDGKPRIQRV